MERTTFAQPLPSPMAADAAVGYRLQSERLQPMPFERIRHAPAGSASATASDMARFMIALLEESSPLSAIAPTLISRAESGPAGARMPTHGLYERWHSGTRSVGHDGGLQFAEARMVLWPEERTGLFLAVNRPPIPGLARRLEHAFADRAGLRLARREAIKPVSDPETYIGHYATNRRSESTAARLAMLVDWVAITPGERGFLTVEMPGNQWSMGETETGVLAAINGDERVWLDASGHVRKASFSPTGYEPVGAWLTPHRQVAIVAVCLSICFIFLVAWLVTPFRRRPPPARSAPLATFGLALISLGWIAFFVLFGVEFANQQALFRGEDARFQLLV
ncbi:MAG: serine hydrolase, partial [Planctomycetota bacterium]